MKYRLKQKKRAFRSACGVYTLHVRVYDANMQGGGGSNRREKKTIKRGVEFPVATGYKGDSRFAFYSLIHKIDERTVPTWRKLEYCYARHNEINESFIINPNWKRWKFHISLNGSIKYDKENNNKIWSIIQENIARSRYTINSFPGRFKYVTWNVATRCATIDYRNAFPIKFKPRPRTSWFPGTTCSR